LRNKWVSCPSSGHLNFNEELLDLDRELWDYVFVHELLHFSVPNNWRLWQSLMLAHLGGYEILKKDYWEKYWANWSQDSGLSLN